MLHELDQPTLVEVVEKSSDIGVQNIVTFFFRSAYDNASSASCGLRPGRNP
jgi:hypothetical protein